MINDLMSGGPLISLPMPSGPFGAYSNSEPGIHNWLMDWARDWGKLDSDLRSIYTLELDALIRATYPEDYE